MYHVDFEMLNDYKEKLKLDLDEFRQGTSRINELEKKLTWTGPAHDKFTNVFEEKFNKLIIIPEAMELYIQFIEKALGDYSDGINEIKVKLDEILQRIKDAKN